MAKLTKKQIEKALVAPTNTKFALWKSQIEGDKIITLDLNTRMSYAVSGMHMGLTLQTALATCGVNAIEFKSWFSDPNNSELVVRANAFAEAQLERVLYDAALADPMLAATILEKRNPRRWTPKELIADNEETTSVKSVANMLRDKKVKLIAQSNRTEIFDVESDGN